MAKSDVIPILDWNLAACFAAQLGVLCRKNGTSTSGQVGRALLLHFRLCCRRPKPFNYFLLPYFASATIASLDTPATATTAYLLILPQHRVLCETASQFHK